MKLISRSIWLVVGILPLLLIVLGNLQCSDDDSAATGSSNSLGSGERDTEWAPCYFYSGGPQGAYTSSQYGELTNTHAVAKNINGGDPSCGACDREGWELCGLIPENTKGRGDGPCKAGQNVLNPDCQAGTTDGVWGFPVAPYAPGEPSAVISQEPEYVSAFASIWALGDNTQDNGICSKTAETGTCNNCYKAPARNASAVLPVFPDGTDTCDGTFQLVNPDPPASGKVACFAHGTFGGTIMPESQNPSCTSSHYVDKYASCNGTSLCPELDALTKQFQHVFAHCGEGCGNLTEYGSGSVAKNGSGDIPCLGGDYASGYVNPDQTFRSCILKPALYAKAEVPWPTWPENIPSSITPASPQGSGDGVALSWGHGVLNGACGAVAYLANPYTNNLMLNVQQGMRAWSGEWTDAINPYSSTAKSFDVTKTTQAYISENMPGGENSVSCLQPEALNESPDNFQALMDAACEILCPGDKTCGCFDAAPGTGLTDQDCTDQNCHDGCLWNYGQDEYECTTTGTQLGCEGQSNPPYYWCK